ncbi:MAG: bifunctional glutamate N-acetyltransferase/amino-acid acetyltransferase ArgJ [Pseudomonadota bacterium]
MPVGLKSPGELLPVPGIRLAAMHCGIKADASVKDLTLFELSDNSQIAAVFTQNRFCAAPVVIAREHLSKCENIRYLLINSGNANAGTGVEGMEAARNSCAALASAGGVADSAVLPFSTGVISTALPVEKITTAVPALVSNLSTDHWLPAAQGIMTTDTLPKACSRQVEVKGQLITITGIAKGSGMIKPDMATMLSFIATDALIGKDQLQSIMETAVEKSFNSITVDGDTSTNDACILVASGVSGQSVSAEDVEFVEALEEVFIWLAQSIIRDGEGATKFVEIRVDGAASAADAKAVAYCVAHSPLVKTALFASDPNWGRILAAVGRAEAEHLDVDKVDLKLGNICLLKGGLPDPGYTEEQGVAAMAGEEIIIGVSLNLGSYSASIWTSDLSYEYVKINAEYRS